MEVLSSTVAVVQVPTAPYLLKSWKQGFFICWRSFYGSPFYFSFNAQTYGRIHSHLKKSADKIATRGHSKALRECHNRIIGVDLHEHVLCVGWPYKWLHKTDRNWKGGAFRGKHDFWQLTSVSLMFSFKVIR